MTGYPNWLVALIVLSVPVALTAAHLYVVHTELKSKWRYLLVGSLVQIALLLLVFGLTFYSALTSIGVAGGEPSGDRPFDLSMWLFGALVQQPVVFLVSYLIVGWLVLDVVSRRMRNRSG